MKNYKGTISSYDKINGKGLISMPGKSSSIFFEKKDIKEKSFNILEGQEVVFSLKKGKFGLQALRIGPHGSDDDLDGK